ncbi:deoxynucleoside triphosphate triphosphohydrolase SAMHD1-like isoform X1 [Stylophora pistillata]|uniref:deoxynucleoside triphosphate triphosphohydrolase SAMHD1-like isoform X1 n=1 Tax=Stylophora pistillata TaxID=50429 RepID=UPI000C048905|nr:deoxynucleoside triphosphate triphosphohydrolase SAMHD1-like isoform X1 [Stylophora pistillata]
MASMVTRSSKRKRGDETQSDDEAIELLPKPHQDISGAAKYVQQLKTPPKAEDGDDNGEEMGEGKVKELNKVFNDCIHGHIEIHPLCVKIINTPQFQRLRDIKQLGGCYYVFPGASHNRFEHSIGTCYLAGKLVEGLCKHQPNPKITPEDVLCVKIAGLCHDLGHGPFSHMFDGLFIPEARPRDDKKWKHENGSLSMFEHMMKANRLTDEFRKHGLHDVDEVFIKELIIGEPLGEPTSEEWRFKGRGKEKSFLYEIVANKRTGIDVDKFDYFARDCHGLGIKNSFDHERYMKSAKVIQCEGEKQICVRDKEDNNLYEMFHTRDSLHRRAYQHKTKNIIEIMIKEALLKADRHVLFKGKKKKFPISKCIDDMEAYIKLTDNVFYKILNSSEPKLEEARDILRRVQCRDLHRFIGKITVKPEENEKISEIEERMKKNVEKEGLQPEDFVFDVVKFNYGMGAENPMDKVRFYSKKKPNEAFPLRKDQISYMLPEKFQERHIRVYFRKNDIELRKKAERWFDQWQKKYNEKGGDAQGEQIPVISPQEGDSNASEAGASNALQESERGKKAKRRISFKESKENLT